MHLKTETEFRTNKMLPLLWIQTYFAKQYCIDSLILCRAVVAPVRGLTIQKESFAVLIKYLHFNKNWDFFLGWVLAVINNFERFPGCIFPLATHEKSWLLFDWHFHDFRRFGASLLLHDKTKCITLVITVYDYYQPLNWDPYRRNNHHQLWKSFPSTLSLQIRIDKFLPVPRSKWK